MLTYTTKIIISNDHKQKLLEFLELERLIYNYCSELHFGGRNTLKTVHDKCYYRVKERFPQAKSQLIIKAEQAVLANYRSAKSCKHVLKSPLVKRRLSIQLDKRLYSRDGFKFRATTLSKRVEFTLVEYPKLSAMKKYEIADPKLFVRDGEIYIAMTFKIPELPTCQSAALGIDLGIRRLAATSDGNIYIDKKFNGDKRKLRYLKRCLNRKNTRSAKQHLKKLQHTEKNRNKNLVHNLANKLLAKSNVLAMESLNTKALKRKRWKSQSKNRISQVSFYLLQKVLTYKAALLGKVVVCVNPIYTSKIDCITGKMDGKRVGCRYYSSSGLVYDADVNAAVNIAKRTKLPVSQKNLLDGQAVVNQPIVG